MTTLYGSKKDLTTSIGFFVVVALAVAVSTLARGSTVVGIVFSVIAVGLVALAVLLRRRPPNELRVSDTGIELHSGASTVASIRRDGTGGSVEILGHIYRGRLFWSLVPDGGADGVPIDDFDIDEIRTAAEAHGWTVSVNGERRHP